VGLAAKDLDAPINAVGDRQRTAFAHSELQHRYVPVSYLADQDFVAVEVITDRSAAHLALHIALDPKS
jgi:hypothetical protein